MMIKGCDFCDQTNLVSVYRPADSKRGVSVVVCQSCGLVQSLFSKKKTTNKKTEEIIEKILFEREILFNEIDTLKQAQNSWIRRHDLNSKHNLLIDEIDELLYNDFYNLSKKLNYEPGEVLTSLMEDFLLK